jgi:hypothetical protein
METAELRKQDRLRAEDKMIQREREREGDEFVDKDAFVTPSYLKQQEELKVAEEEEKKREGASPALLFPLSHSKRLTSRWESQRLKRAKPNPA